MKLADTIKHLSLEEIEELYERYLGGAKNNELCELYKINVTPSQLIKLLPDIERRDHLCPYCHVPMWQKRKSKSAYNDNDMVSCDECGHIKYIGEYENYKINCTCECCAESKRYLEEQRLLWAKDTIRKKYNPDNKPPIPYSELKFLDKLTLLTLLKVQTEESFTYIQPLKYSGMAKPIAPTNEMVSQLVSKLIKTTVVIADPDSHIEAFYEDDDYKSFYTFRVQYLTNITFDGATRASLDDIFRNLYNDFLAEIKLEWSEEIHHFIFWIAREEIVQYLEMKTEELNMPLSPEKKSREIVMQLLNDFSVSEIYYFASNAVEKAHIFYSKGRSKGKKHASNTIPARMLSLGERAINEHWDAYYWNRDSRVPRSAISEVFFDLFLQDPDGGFRKAPGKHWAQELNPKYFIGKVESDEDMVCCQSCGSLFIETKLAGQMIKLTCNDCGWVNEYKSLNN